MNDLLQFMENNGVRLYTVFVDQRASVRSPWLHDPRERRKSSVRLKELGGIVNDLTEVKSGPALQYAQDSRLVAVMRRARSSSRTMPGAMAVHECGRSDKRFGGRRGLHCHAALAMAWNMR